MITLIAYKILWNLQQEQKVTLITGSFQDHNFALINFK